MLGRFLHVIYYVYALFSEVPVWDFYPFLVELFIFPIANY